MGTQASTAAGTTEHPRGWFKRNWKWFVPTLILAPLVIGAISLGGYVLLRASKYKASEPYKMALSEVLLNKEVADRLGAPVVDGWNPSGNLPTDSQSGTARFNFNIFGPQGQADVATSARLVDGEWGITNLEITFADGTRRSLMGGIRQRQVGGMPKFNPNAKQPSTSDPAIPPPPTTVDIPEVGIPKLPPGVE